MDLLIHQVGCLPSRGETLKTQVIIENVPGASGTIAAERVAGSPPDGYTVFFHHIGFSTAPSLYRELPYDSMHDFEPIGMVWKRRA